MRLFGLVGTASVVLVPIALLWLILHLALGGYNPVAEGFVLVTIFGLPVLCGLLYLRQLRSRLDD